MRHRRAALHAHSSRVGRASVCWGAAGVPPHHATAPCIRTCAGDAHCAPVWSMWTMPYAREAPGEMSATLSPPTARPLDHGPIRSSLRHTFGRRHTGESRGSVGTRDGVPCGPAQSHLTVSRRSVPSSRSCCCDRPICDGWMVGQPSTVHPGYIRGTASCLRRGGTAAESGRAARRLVRCVRPARLAACCAVPGSCSASPVRLHAESDRYVTIL